jgi:hypothetical protein
MATQLREIIRDDQREIEQMAMSIPAHAKALKIIDAASYQRGGELIVAIKGLRKQIDECFDPIVKKAHEAHKEAVAQKKKVEAPLVEAEGLLKPALAAWDTKQEELRRAEQRRLEEEARKRAEDEQLAYAAQAERCGDKEAAQAILDAPVEVAPVIMTTAPKLAGVSYRETWSAQVTDMMALVKAVAAGQQPLSLLVVNIPGLNGMARALKGALNIPGVKAVCEKTVAAGSRS